MKFSKKDPQFERPEIDPDYRKLRPEYADVASKVPPSRYGQASAHLFAEVKTTRRRFAVM